MIIGFLIFTILGKCTLLFFCSFLIFIFLKILLFIALFTVRFQLHLSSKMPSRHLLAHFHDFVTLVEPELCDGDCSGDLPTQSHRVESLPCFFQLTAKGIKIEKQSPNYSELLGPILWPKTNWLIIWDEKAWIRFAGTDIQNIVIIRLSLWE